MDVQNALTTIYANDKDGEFEPITAHYIKVTVTASFPSDPQAKIPVSGIPVEIVPTEADQIAYMYDPDSGNVARKRVPAYSRQTMEMNLEGSSFVAFGIQDPEHDLRVQKFLIRSEFMGTHDWVGHMFNYYLI